MWYYPIIQFWFFSKDLFTNYVSQKWGCLNPPAPFVIQCQHCQTHLHLYFQMYQHMPYPSYQNYWKNTKKKTIVSQNFWNFEMTLNHFYVSGLLKAFFQCSYLLPDPSSPLHQPISAFYKPPPPPLDADIICEQGGRVARFSLFWPRVQLAFLILEFFLKFFHDWSFTPF